jgi:hypothetical protein
MAHQDRLQELRDLCTGKKNHRFSLLDSHINAGESASLGLPMPELLGFAPLYMPIRVINGKHEGPTVLLFATMRGDEFNGLEIIRNFLALDDLNDMHGRILAVPVLNVYGLLNRRPDLPGGQRLETAFPGSVEGRYSERLAHLFVDDLFQHCDIAVEFSSGEMHHNSLPHVHTDFGTPGNRELAADFPVSLIVDERAEPGSIQEVARTGGQNLLSYRAGEAMHTNPHAIRLGQEGLTNLLTRLGMLPSRESEPVELPRQPLIAESSEWVYSTKSGIAEAVVQLGDQVSAGQKLADIREPFGSFQEVTAKAPTDGVVVGLNEVPMVYEGDPLIRVARFAQPERAATTLQTWSEQELPADAGTDSAQT